MYVCVWGVVLRHITVGRLQLITLYPDAPQPTFILKCILQYFAFPPQDTGWFSPQRCSTGRVSTAKKMGVFLLQYSSVGVHFELHTPSVDWSTESALPCDRGIITNPHSTRGVFLNNGESFVYWRKCCAKVCRPPWTSYIVAFCSLRVLLFHWIY